MDVGTLRRILRNRDDSERVLTTNRMLDWVDLQGYHLKFEKAEPSTQKKEVK